jgi:hypothetical protein
MSYSKLPIHWCKRESQLMPFSSACLKIVDGSESCAARASHFCDRSCAEKHHCNKSDTQKATSSQFFMTELWRSVSDYFRQNTVERMGLFSPCLGSRNCSSCSAVPPTIFRAGSGGVFLQSHWPFVSDFERFDYAVLNYCGSGFSVCWFIGIHSFSPISR